MRERAVTIALPICEPTHPPYSEWPTAALVRGICPKCGWHAGSDPKAARELKARRLVEARDDGSAGERR